MTRCAKGRRTTIGDGCSVSLELLGSSSDLDKVIVVVGLPLFEIGIPGRHRRDELSNSCSLAILQVDDSPDLNVILGNDGISSEQVILLHRIDVNSEMLCRDEEASD